MLIAKYLFKTSIIFNKKQTLLCYVIASIMEKKTHDKRTMRNRCNKFEIFKIDNDSIFFVPLSLDSAKREHLRWIRNHWEMLMLYKKKKKKKRLKAVTSDICKSGRRLSLPPWIPRIRPWKNWISDSRSRPLPCRGILNNVVGSMKSRIAATKNYSAFSFIHSSFFFFFYIRSRNHVR